MHDVIGLNAQQYLRCEKVNNNRLFAVFYLLQKVLVVLHFERTISQGGCRDISVDLCGDNLPCGIASDNRIHGSGFALFS